MNKIKLLIISFSFASFGAWSQVSPLFNEFKQLVIDNKIGPTTDQAFCYQDGTEISGYQVDKLQRLASLTKIFTTFFAVETLDLNQRYTTKFYLTSDRLHIEGSKDPYFEEEKMLLLMKALNDRGYKKFKKVTFSSDFKFFDLGQDSHQNLTSVDTKKRLSVFFNTKSNLGLIWDSVLKFAEEEGYEINEREKPAIDAKLIALSDNNPLLNENPIIFSHTSRPLHSILKSMNVMSKNKVAQNIFLEASRIMPFQDFMDKNNIKASTYKIRNGSGLPIKGKDYRLDNLSTCKTILVVLGLLKTNLENKNLRLEQVLAVVGGQDLGSFRERFLEFPETHDAVIAKTGTINHASSLSGFLLVDDAIPFAILNHTSQIKGARSLQDDFVSIMLRSFGNPISLNYSKISIFPLINPDFFELQNIN